MGGCGTPTIGPKAVGKRKIPCRRLESNPDSSVNQRVNRSKSSVRYCANTTSNDCTVDIFIFGNKTSIGTFVFISSHMKLDAESESEANIHFIMSVCWFVATFSTQTHVHKMFCIKPTVMFVT
jgi:hypothetical protein